MGGRACAEMQKWAKSKRMKKIEKTTERGIRIEKENLKNKRGEKIEESLEKMSIDPGEGTSKGTRKTRSVDPEEEMSKGKEKMETEMLEGWESRVEEPKEQREKKKKKEKVYIPESEENKSGSTIKNGQ